MEIIIIGGLLDGPRASTLLDRLQAEVSADVTWDWIECNLANEFNAPRSVMNRLSEKLNRWRAAQRQDPLSTVPQDLRVIKLFDIHGRTQGALYKCWPEPILSPSDARTSEELIRWLISPAANLFPPSEWWAGNTEAALIAILCKLLRRKYWNADVGGHEWLKETVLLNQSPVTRPEFGEIRIEAGRLLPTLAGCLLLTKGSGQGKTPKEWSINSAFLPQIKRSIIAMSLEPMNGITCISGLLERIASDPNRSNRLDIDVVTEIVRSICRQR